MVHYNYIYSYKSDVISSGDSQLHCRDMVH